MFCKNCGEKINNKAAICLSCGAKVGEGSSYCYNCGEYTGENASVCLNCGYSQEIVSEKSKLAAALLAVFLGGIGIHNFYLGYTKKAIVQLLLGTLGIFFIIGPLISGTWGLIEGILIFTGQIDQDAKGNKLSA
ncbi:MAG: TM2 domain-containing protein [Bacillota bacterium]|nr:TM2 domain-containing protein [Bacillota bacterium]